MKKFNLSVVITIPSQPKNNVKSVDIHTSAEFLDQFSGLDGILPHFNYQISLFHDDLTPDWYQQNENDHKQGGHFNIFFSTNIQAYRSFCILCVDFINNNIEFCQNIDGILVGIKNYYWFVQIWVNDGFISAKVGERYSILLNYIQNVIGIKDIYSFEIGFHVHPTYKQFTLPQAANKLANKIKTFQACINEVVGDLEEKTPLQFDLNVATRYKRSRKERRKNPSYVDNIMKP